MTILKWVTGLYEERIFTDTDALISPLFGQLTLTAGKLLKAEL
ncbi:MAG: hypothetical protein AAFY11_14745 [Cyanobacteria bacterium J06641_5]